MSDEDLTMGEVMDEVESLVRCPSQHPVTRHSSPRQPDVRQKG